VDRHITLSLHEFPQILEDRQHHDCESFIIVLIAFVSEVDGTT
jgi:hypothetical protein